MDNTYLVAGKRIPAHPMTDCWWLMSDEELRDLADDIKKNGQREPVVVSRDGARLLDGRDRCKACEILGRPVLAVTCKDGVDEDVVAVNANAKRKHGTRSQLELVAARMANTMAGCNQHSPIGTTTNADAASICGVSKRQISRARQILDDPILVESVENRTLPVSVAHRIKDETEQSKQEVIDLTKSLSAEKAAEKVLEKRRKSEAARKKAELLGRQPDTNPVEWHTCAVKDLPVADDSVDWIITDPPYEEAAVQEGVYADLSKTAYRVLKPGGGLVVLVGQVHLPRVFSQLEQSDLKYRWILTFNQPGAKRPNYVRQIFACCKPIILYIKPGGERPRRVTDLINSPFIPRQENEYHKWQQSESGMDMLVKHFAVPQETVCDPFSGGGTIPLVAKRHGCRVIAADIDADCIKSGKDRINMWYNKSDSDPVPPWGVDGSDWKQHERTVND